MPKPTPREVPFATHPCPCRTEHAPPVAFTHRHHVHPLYAGGTEDESNVVILCSATHDWVHVMLRTFERDGLVARKRSWPRYAYRVAVQGWESMA